MELKEDYNNTKLGLLPKDWKWNILPNVLENGADSIKIGPFGSALKKEILVKSGYKVYGQENIFNKNMEIGTRYINFENFKKLKNCELKTGDIIISMMGTIGQCHIIPEHVERGIMDSHLLRLRLDQYSIDPIFFIYFFESNLLLAQIKKLSVGGIMDGLSSKIIKNLCIITPPKKEQAAIAKALSDADAWIQSLTQLIAKKRQIKQGAMQTLLNPYKNGILKEGWKCKKLGDILAICHGKSQKEVVDENGVYPILASGGEIGKASQYLYDKPSVLIGRKGTIDIPQYMDKPFWTIDTLFYSKINFPNNARYIFYLFNLIDWYSFNEASGVPSLSAKTIENIEIFIPQSEEQNDIAKVLSDMDKEIYNLEEKLLKAKQIKQGMMQNLLTGRIRLI
ncbi:restriction endonuclease subunit S [Legionella pneumophila]|uniref:restriction endonuclease subunit S n=1 Tax=Legionella pneumophila TaxID=446 RepID=UPI0036F475A2